MKTFHLYRVNTEMEKNLARVADIISKNRFEQDGPFRVTNMIRANINVNMSSQLEETFRMLDSDRTTGIQIVSVRNNLLKPLQNVVINFIYQNTIIGEIALTYGSKESQ